VSEVPRSGRFGPVPGRRPVCPRSSREVGDPRGHLTPLDRGRHCPSRWAAGVTGLARWRDFRPIAGKLGASRRTTRHPGHPRTSARDNVTHYRGSRPIAAYSTPAGEQPARPAHPAYQRTPTTSPSTAVLDRYRLTRRQPTNNPPAGPSAYRRASTTSPATAVLDRYRPTRRQPTNNPPARRIRVPAHATTSPSAAVLDRYRLIWRQGRAGRRHAEVR
jgi:hypothetical protein